jgi:hypothetical protein
MIGRMPLRYRLATVIWAAIFMIAAQFFAGPALAHAGHSHDHSAASHSSAVHLPDDGQRSSGELAELQEVDLSQTWPSGTDMPITRQPAGCTGGCCGKGIGCCGAVLVAASSPLPDYQIWREAVSLVFDRQSGLDPEAPARPPRPLA